MAKKHILQLCFLLVLGLPGIIALQPVSQVAAQSNDSTQAILPDISPREVEIRGELQIAFPSLLRQPLIGFNPPPRVPDVPANRRPFIEDYKIASADLPNTPLGKPDSPVVNSLADLQPVNGEFEASSGRYLSRIIRARLSMPFNRNSAIYSRVDYEGTEGHFLEDDTAFPDLRNPYDGLFGLIGYESGGPKAGWGVELDGNVNSYTLSGTNLLENGVISSDVILPDRNGLTGNGTFWIRSQAAASVDTEFRLTYGATRFQTDLFDNALNELPRLDQREKRLSSMFDLSVPFSLGSFLLSTDVSGAGVDDEGLFEFPRYDLSLSSGFQIDISPKFNIVLAGRYLGTSLVENGESAFNSYLTADAQINLYPSPGITFYLRNQPGVDRNSLWDVFEKNPYVNDMAMLQPNLQSTLRPIDAVAGFKFFKGKVQMAVRGGYIQSPNFLFFESLPDQPGITGYKYEHGIFKHDFADVEILHAEGDISISFSSNIHAKLGISVRDAKLTDTDTNVPYYSPIVSENMVTYSFYKKRMMLQLLTAYHSGRHRSRNDDSKVSDYFNLDMSYSYKLHSGLGMIVRLDNIIGSNLEYWEHYQETPLTISAGIRVLW